MKTWIAGCSKRVRAEAREKSASVGVLSEYVVARRSSATKDMTLFQQPASPDPRLEFPKVPRFVLQLQPLFDCPVPFLDRRDFLIIAENVESPGIEEKMAPGTGSKS